MEKYMNQDREEDANEPSRGLGASEWNNSWAGVIDALFEKYGIHRQ